jgi:hypothetical protein
VDIQTVSTAIANTLAALDVHVYDYGPDAPISPAIFIYPLDIPEYAATFDQTVRAEFVVRFLVATVVTQGGQSQLNGLLSPTGDSAVAAIREDPTFGDVVQSSLITTMRNYGVVQLPDAATRYFSAELVIEVLA